MAKPLVEELQSMIEAQMPKTAQYPGGPIAMEAMDIEGIVSDKPEVAAPAPAPAPAPVDETIWFPKEEKKPGLSSNILDELAKYQGLPSTLEESAQMSTKSYEPLLKSLEGKKQDASWIDFASMALPALIGARYGQLGVGASLGGEYGLQRAREIQKRNESLEDAMTRVRAQIAVQQAKNRKTMQEKKVEVMGQDGNAYLVPESFAISRGLQAFKEGSFDKVKYVDDAGEQRWAAFDKKRGAYRTSTGDILAEKDEVSQSEMGKDKRQKLAQTLAAKKEFIKPTSPFGVLLEENRNLVTAANLLNKGGTIAESGLPSLLARGVFREKGVLTEQDVTRVKGDPSLIAKYNRQWSALIEGKPLTDYDREDIRVLLNISQNVVKDRLNKQLEAYTGVYPELDLQDLRKYKDSLVEDLPDFSKTRVIPARQKAKENIAALAGEDQYKLIRQSIKGPDGKILKDERGNERKAIFKVRKDGKRMEDGKLGIFVRED